MPIRRDKVTADAVKTRYHSLTGMRELNKELGRYIEGADNKIVDAAKYIIEVLGQDSKNSFQDESEDRRRENWTAKIVLLGLVQSHEDPVMSKLAKFKTDIERYSHWHFWAMAHEKLTFKGQSPDDALEAVGGKPLGLAMQRIATASDCSVEFVVPADHTVQPPIPEQRIMFTPVVSAA